MGTQRKNTTIKFPIPSGGWNARDALDAMQPNDAVIMDNIYPAEGYLSWRKGYTLADSSGITSGSTIKTIFEFANAAVQHQIIANDATIYRADVAQVNVLASGFTEGRWDWVNFNGYAIMANGADAMQYYNAATAATLPLIVGTTGNTIKKGTTVSSAFTTSSSIIGIHAHRGHLYLWEDDSQKFYYGGLNEVFPEIEEFNLGYVADLGGKLVAVGSWAVNSAADTLGGGQFNDVLVFAFDNGQLMVYSGDDPGSNFSLLGVFRIGRPLGRECMVRVADELLIATEDGLTPLSQVLQSGRADRTALVSDKIRGAWLDATGQYFDNQGWQVHYYPKINYVLVNIPVRPVETAATGEARYDQFVFNLNTKAWCRFKNQTAACWGNYAGNLYFGGCDNASLFQADNSNSDNGTAIYGEVRFAYRQFPEPAHVNAIQPAVFTDGSPIIYVGCETSYQNSTRYLVKYTPTPPGATWDEIAIDWDLWETPWGSDDSAIQQNWKSILGSGDAVNVRVQSDTTDILRIYSMDVRLEGITGLV